MEVADHDIGTDEDFGSIKVLSRQGGAHGSCHDDFLVNNVGDCVRYDEDVAMRLMKERTNVSCARGLAFDICCRFRHDRHEPYSWVTA